VYKRQTFYQDIFRAGGGVHKFYIGRAQYKYEKQFARKVYLLKKKLSLSYHITNFIEKLTFESPYLKTIIAPTNFAKKQIEENFSPKAKIVVIRNGVNLKRFNIKRRKRLREEFRRDLNLPNLPILGYVSSNFRLKGFLYLLEALYILKKSGFRFVLLTAGENRENWSKKIERLELKNSIIFLGHTREVEKVYFSSDIFIYPTLFDASANVILEAMASGLPVIASTYSGTVELIENKDFIIHRPENPIEISEVLKEVLSLGQDKLEEIGYKNFQIASKYPQEEVFEKYLQLIE
jgi:UDP-glucose:(heptosyl)LPS alpha-1,3-glucosyltransferase